MLDTTAEVRALVKDAAAVAEGEEREILATLLELFDQPLRIAIAGMVKAGKSTLLNALVGQRIAATDAGECTRIVTRYQRGQRYRVQAVSHDGSAADLRFDRGEELTIHLDGRQPEDIERLQVDWPTDRLSDRQLVDTPGLGSISHDVSERSMGFLTSNRAIPVDAVLYLMRHRHPADLAFLEAFHGGYAGSGGMSAIAVLSRADELAGGRADALEVATGTAERLAADMRLRYLCQTVVPVAGLMAETAATLRHDEFQLMSKVAEVPEDRLVMTLLSVDRFRSDGEIDLDAEQRERLIDRFGMYGIRLAVGLVRSGECPTSDRLADRLAARSGIARLRDEIRIRFDSRRGALRARTALSVMAGLDVSRDPAVATGFERVAVNAHEVVELNLLDRLRGREVAGLDDSLRTRLERVLGADGPAPTRRLGIEDTIGGSDVADEAGRHIQEWRTIGEHPLASPELAHLARMATRSLEALVAIR